MAGRRPKPTALKLVTGNPGKRPLNEDEPQPDGVPVKPDFLKGRAAEIWDEYFPRLFWLTEADSHNFAAWCSLAEEIEARLMMMDAARITQWRMLGAELGVTPASRTKLSTKRSGKNEKDPAEKYLR